ncbi:MAG: ABC transporter permease [Sphingomonas sp.]
MSKFRTLVRQTMTIARRDFIATVFTPTFLIFLFAPVLIGSFSLIGGLGARAAAGSRDDRITIVAITDTATAGAMTTIDTRLRAVYREPGEAPPPLGIEPPHADPAAQAKALMAKHGTETVAVLYGSLERPHVLYTLTSARAGNYLAELAEQALRARRSGGAAPLSTATRELVAGAGRGIKDGQGAGFAAVFAMFLLTTLLAGQVVSGVAEEKGNKVIEVLAAAVPLESVFFGKLLGTFGVALLFIAFWSTLLGQVTTLMPANMAAGVAALTPAIGLPAFLLFFLLFFMMAYMLLGAVFLGVGAQASTVREIQLLSLPITIVNVAMFGLASAAASAPHSWIATFARLFPLSSPFAMAARAAQSPDMWPNVAALAWQALWVAIFIAVGVRAFRRGVLQSGSGKIGWKAIFRRA